VKINEKKFHPECLVCPNCSTPLAGKKMMKRGGVLLCTPCGSLAISDIKEEVRKNMNAGFIQGTGRAKSSRNLGIPPPPPPPSLGSPVSKPPNLPRPPPPPPSSS